MEATEFSRPAHERRRGRTNTLIFTNSIHGGDTHAHTQYNPEEPNSPAGRAHTTVRRDYILFSGSLPTHELAGSLNSTRTH